MRKSVTKWWAWPACFLAVWLLSAVCFCFISPYFKAWSWGKFFEFTVPLYVIALEVYMLYNMHRESRERARTLDEFQKLRKEFDRDQYMQNIAKEISKAEKIARFTSRSMETSENDLQANILKAVQDRLSATPNYKHKGLLAKRPEVLPGAIDLLLKAPADALGNDRIELRVSIKVAQSRFSFFVRDSRVSILGIGKGDPHLNKVIPTSESTLVESMLLAKALEDYFDKIWDKSEKLSDYIDQHIAAMNEGVSLLAREIRQWFGVIESGEKASAFDNLLCRFSKTYEEILKKEQAAGAPVVPR
jgi:hypothetical protein